MYNDRLVPVHIFAEPETEELPEKLHMTSDIILDPFIKLYHAFFYEKGEFDIESRATFKVTSQCTPSILYNKGKKPKQNLYYRQNKILGLL